MSISPDKRTYRTRVISSQIVAKMTDADIRAAKNARSHQRNLARQEANILKDANASVKWRSLGPSEQLTLLDKWNGVGKGASRQRARLAKILAEAPVLKKAA